MRSSPRLCDLLTLVALLVPGVSARAQAPTIAAGSSHTCAVRQGGTVACWGRGDEGQRGDGSTTVVQSTPVNVQGVGGTGVLTGVIALAAGDAHTCALVADGDAAPGTAKSGTVACWGRGTYGALGDGTKATAQVSPVVVRGVGGIGTLTDVTALEAGGYHTCAVRKDRTAACWGSGIYGQLGDGKDSYEQLTPVVVQAVGGGGALTGVTAIAAGEYHTCAAREGGTAVCWGFGSFYQLGNNTDTQSQKTPVTVRTPFNEGELSGVTGIAAGAIGACALRTGGTAACWGSGPLGADVPDSGSSTPTVVQAVGGGYGTQLGNITALTQGQRHACAARAGGAAVCWGIGSDGQRGDGTTRDQLTAAAVQASGGPLTGVTAIAAGGAHTCALLSGGTAVCWGNGEYGQRGDGMTTRTQATPVAVVGGGFVPVEEFPTGAAVARFTLSPNPARTRATATLALPHAGFARVALYDALGREVALVFDGHATGPTPLALDVSGLAPGVYVVRAVAGREVLTRMLVVAR